MALYLKSSIIRIQYKLAEWDELRCSVPAVRTVDEYWTRFSRQVIGDLPSGWKDSGKHPYPRSVRKRQLIHTTTNTFVIIIFIYYIYYTT